MGCSRRRPDWFHDCGTHSIIVECDEDQHSDRESICENRRTMEIFGDLGGRPLVLIRFNPDKYTDDTTVVRGCFKFDKENNIAAFVKEFDRRYTQLLTSIGENTKKIPTKELTVINLFYNQ
jgi:hypothetical protein